MMQRYVHFDEAYLRQYADNISVSGSEPAVRPVAVERVDHIPAATLRMMPVGEFTRDGVTVRVHVE